MQNGLQCRRSILRHLARPAVKRPQLQPIHSCHKPQQPALPLFLWLHGLGGGGLVGGDAWRRCHVPMPSMPSMPSPPQGSAWRLVPTGATIYLTRHIAGVPFYSSQPVVPHYLIMPLAARGWVDHGPRTGVLLLAPPTAFNHATSPPPSKTITSLVHKNQSHKALLRANVQR